MNKEFPVAQLPLVSVIIPTFDRLHYLPYAIESALAQTYRNIEAIVTDDAGTVDVQGLIRSYRDPRLHYRRNERNLGQAMNNLIAFKEAKGKYVANLHDDDMWEPTFLEKLVPVMESDDDVALAFSDHFVMDSAGKIDELLTQQIEKQYQRNVLKPGLHKPFCRIGLVDLSIPLAMASVLRKDAIDWSDFPPEINSFYDRWLIYLACRTGMGAYYYPERLTRYRVHSASATSGSGIDFPRSGLACHNRFMQDERLKSLWPELQVMRDGSYTKLGICYLEAGNRREAQYNLLQSIKSKPSLRAIAALGLSVLPASMRRSIHNKQ